MRAQRALSFFKIIINIIQLIAGSSICFMVLNESVRQVGVVPGYLGAGAVMNRGDGHDVWGWTRLVGPR
jgi:hypothetical protein